MGGALTGGAGCDARTSGAGGEQELQRGGSNEYTGARLAYPRPVTCLGLAGGAVLVAIDQPASGEGADLVASRQRFGTAFGIAYSAPSKAPSLWLAGA